MTYRHLLKRLQETYNGRLDDDVTIFDVTTLEYIPVGSICEVGDEQDVLDEGHLVLTIET